VSSTESSGLSSTGSTGASDQRPLTQQEYQLLQRLLSDPFSLPIQFKTWLVSYLETSDLSLPLGAIQGLTQLLGITGVGSSGTLGILPAGIVLPYGGSAAPTGAKMCDGASYSTTTEQRLFDAIGYGFGGSGPTFNVPDLQERIPVGKGVLALLNALGKNEGLPLGSRGIIHRHTKYGTTTLTGANSTLTLSGYTAVSSTPGSGGAGFSTGDRAVANNFGLGGANSTLGISDTISVGPAGTPLDGPAFLVLNFIVVA
jgi:microcystin-dependent protein